MTEKGTGVILEEASNKKELVVIENKDESPISLVQNSVDKLVSLALPVDLIEAQEQMAVLANGLYDLKFAMKMVVVSLKHKKLKMRENSKNNPDDASLPNFEELAGANSLSPSSSLPPKILEQLLPLFEGKNKFQQEAFVKKIKNKYFDTRKKLREGIGSYQKGIEEAKEFIWLVDGKTGKKSEDGKKLDPGLKDKLKTHMTHVYEIESGFYLQQQALAE